MENTVRRGLGVVVVVTLSFLLLWWLVPRGVDSGGWQVTAVTSGDTIQVERAGVRHTVHLLGVAAPDPRQCGFEASRAYLEGSVGGATVTLLEGTSDGTLPDGSWRRYVEIQKLDAGLAQIAQAQAVADGTVHDRQAEYEQVDAATPDPCGAAAP